MNLSIFSFASSVVLAVLVSTPQVGLVPSASSARTVVTASLTAGPGTPYCFGVNCPCGNDDPTAGCINSTGVGALLDGFGSNSVAAADLGLDLTNLPPTSVTLILLSSQTGEKPFKDGKLCLGGTIWRLWKHFNSGQGGALNIPNVQYWFAIGGPFITFAPGETWNFQSWYRDPPATQTACGLKSNLTNGYAVTFVP